MKLISLSALYTVGRNNLSRWDGSDRFFLEAGRFPNGEADPKYRYRYLLYGVPVELTEEELHQTKNLNDAASIVEACNGYWCFRALSQTMENHHEKEENN